MRAIRTASIALLLVALLRVAPSHATAFSTDQSDLWWNPAESGWGIQFVDRAAIIFATMFVYGASTAPVWYTATLNATSPQSWTGDLYVTSGPAFGNPVFNPAGVTFRNVGTMTWNLSSATAGVLHYTVDGVAVTKNLVRQFIALDDFSGTFLSALHQTMSGCANPADNGTVETFATLATTQQATNFGFTLAAQIGLACTFAGTLTQDGRFGTATGMATCGGGGPQPVTLSTMVVGFNSLTLHYDSQAGNGCVTSGYFSGARHR